MLVPITGRARPARWCVEPVTRGAHGPPLGYRSTFRATAKMGRRASEATKLPCEVGATAACTGYKAHVWFTRSGVASRLCPLGSCRRGTHDLERGDRLVPVQLVVERLQADAERLGRLLLVPAVLVQGGENEAALGFGQRATDLELDHPARCWAPSLRPVLGVRAHQW